MHRRSFPTLLLQAAQLLSRFTKTAGLCADCMCSVSIMLDYRAMFIRQGVFPSYLMIIEPLVRVVVHHAWHKLRFGDSSQGLRNTLHDSCTSITLTVKCHTAHFVIRLH